MKKIIVAATVWLSASLMASGLWAADMSPGAHGQVHKPAGQVSHQTHDDMQKSVGSAFEHQMVDNNVRAEFQIMSLASMNLKDPGGATHHLMVKLLDNKMNHQIKDAVGKVKVVGVDSTEQISELENYSGIFAANLTFRQKGKYGVICLLKVNGAKHMFKFWYPHE